MLTVFGSVAVGIMMLSYTLEARSKWYLLAFAVASAATAIEAVWSLIALRRFVQRAQAEPVSLPR